ncbi:MAG TPA: FKBP-type peptidyl-prolyl cis-trans isomerase [Candidatus Saccharimonadales bacterium]|nr:FKBP-type peptidyl-prolyl cis-trans isomerase [Candidatus Saccharimonadales bacterium]
MTRRRLIVVVAVCLVVVAAGVGLWWQGRGAEPEPNGKQTVGDHTISLNQQPPEDTGGLSVSSGSASDLGQLGGQSQNTDSGSGGADKPDFARYDKYKNSKSALFGDIKKGTGAALIAGKKGTVLYKGWLTNGTLVDQSPISPGGEPQPYTFTMGAHEVILGWEEAMYGMKEGGTRLLIIPPAVGYGSEGKGLVPPNAVLVFEARLTKVR